MDITLHGTRRAHFTLTKVCNHKTGQIYFSGLSVKAVKAGELIPLLLKLLPTILHNNIQRLLPLLRIS
jgi:hypothetical protein